jgi:hypothetical protein
MILRFDRTAWAASVPAQGEENMNIHSMDVISLSGEWYFKIDAENAGLNEEWFCRHLPDKLKLPGSTDEGHYGERTVLQDPHRLNRIYEYIGAAWYQKEVTIPKEYENREILLFLERAHWETRLWIDGREAGMRDSLCTPHIYNLTGLLHAGRHTITLRVDNTVKYDIGESAHSITKETQTNWNGVIGRIELRVMDLIHICGMQVYPDIRSKNAKVLLDVENNTGRNLDCTITLEAKSFNCAMPHVRTRSQCVSNPMKKTKPWK